MGMRIAFFNRKKNLMGDNNINNNIDVGKPERIYLYQAYEVKYWTNKFGVSEDELKKAVKAAGHRVPDVELYFKRDKKIV
jgi:Protein of unknown function (DUF3606)